MNHCPFGIRSTECTSEWEVALTTLVPPFSSIESYASQCPMNSNPRAWSTQIDYSWFHSYGSTTRNNGHFLAAWIIFSGRSITSCIVNESTCLVCNVVAWTECFNSCAWWDVRYDRGISLVFRWLPHHNVERWLQDGRPSDILQSCKISYRDIHVARIEAACMILCYFIHSQETDQTPVLPQFRTYASG